MFLFYFLLVTLTIFPFPSTAHGIVYSTVEEALGEIFPHATGFSKDKVRLTEMQRGEAEEILGKKITEEEFTFIIGLKGTTPLGYALTLNVIGKELPITFMVACDPEGRIIGVRVLVYRESEGSEIRHRRFMRQFIGKTVKDPLRINREIDAITGATLSSRSAAYAVQKMLALFQVVYKEKVD